MNIKDITMPLIIHYYLLSIQNTTQSFHAKSRPVSSVSAPGRWHNATDVRAKPCVHRFNYSVAASRSSRQGPVDIVNPKNHNDDSSHLTHTLININNMKFQLIV